jgi:high-affinity Fe2+/Pb2+ permease
MTTPIITILSLLILVLIVFLVITVNKSSKKLQYYESVISRNYMLVENLEQSVRELDEKQMFEKDDEVGVIFDQIKTIIEFHSKLIKF